VPSVRLAASSLADGPATIAYRSLGRGDTVVVFLHGGWGYEVYPFDAPTRMLAGGYRILIPDRCGHGRSSPVRSLPLDFHRRAAEETSAFLDELGVDKAVWWGHSDGAVIAAMAAIDMPERVMAVVLEALHLYRNKPGSRQFFEQMASRPDTFGPRVKSVLREDHGADWPRVLRLDGQAWLDLAASSRNPTDDLYGGRLSLVDRPALLVHGGRDPRSEPGEFAAICASLPHAVVSHWPDGGHSPHSEPSTADAVSRAAATFLGGRPEAQQDDPTGG
jgi:pimeloyl-ACP methyl ester carboxylesterase